MGEGEFVISVLEIPEVFLKTAYVFHIASGAD